MSFWKLGSRVIRRLALAAALLAVLTAARYRVRAGDTYASIADAFGVSEANLRKANPYKPVLVKGDIVTVPISPPQQRWSPAHPYAPPVPTVAQLQEEITNGNVEITENPEYRGYYFMWAGKDKDIEIGQIHPVKLGTRTVHDFYLFDGIGEAPGASKLARTTTFKRPMSVESCVCIPAGK